MLGQDIAQMALVGGANDLDGTVSEEKISRMAGGRSGHMIDRAYIHSLVEDVGKTPTERNTIYEVVKEFSSNSKSQTDKPFSVVKLSSDQVSIQPKNDPSFGRFFLSFQDFVGENESTQRMTPYLNWQDIPFRSPQKSKLTIDDQTEVASDGSPIITGARNGDPRFKLVGLIKAAGINLDIDTEPQVLQNIYHTELDRLATHNV
jgi:hypothetical protein